jgi:hypothetical protein
MGVPGKVPNSLLLEKGILRYCWMVVSPEAEKLDSELSKQNLLSFRFGRRMRIKQGSPMMP